MMIRYLIYQAKDPDSKGGGISITAETSDFHVDSVELLHAFKRAVQAGFPTLKGDDGIKIEGLSIQAIDYSDREKPSGKLGEVISLG